jgi:nitroreductase
MNKKQLADSLAWRYATKRFDPSRKVSAEDLQSLLDATNLAPTSYGLQPFRFYIVESPALRAQLRTASWNQGQITDSSHLLVMATLKSIRTEHVDAFMGRIVRDRGVTLESLAKYRQVILGDLVDGARASAVLGWTQRQAYIAMGFLMMAAAVLEIDTCPIEGIDTHRYDELLGITGTDFTTVAAVPIGYRAADDKHATLPKVRMRPEELYEFK